LIAVLHAGATPTLHEHAQLEVRIALTTNQVADLAGGGIGENQAFGRGLGHAGHTTRRI
jgi:hypothetical protein